MLNFFWSSWDRPFPLVEGWIFSTAMVGGRSGHPVLLPLLRKPDQWTGQRDSLSWCKSLDVWGFEEQGLAGRSRPGCHGYLSTPCSAACPAVSLQAPLRMVVVLALRISVGDIQSGICRRGWGRGVLTRSNRQRARGELSN